MNTALRHRQKGTVVLVALCFVAVLGIALTTYVVLCTRTMALSNLSSLKANSEQLAELGLEEALRSLNNNNYSGWTSGTSPNQIVCAWSTSGTTANGTITFPSSQYGNLNITGTVDIRIYNYNTASNLAAWNSSTPYAINDKVSYLGRCYQCTAASTNNTPPNTTYWSDITPYIYAQGSARLPDNTQTTSRTQVRADLALQPLFPNAIGGISTVSFSSGGTVDSYDSSRGTYNQTTLPFNAFSPNVSYSAVVATPSLTTSGSLTINGMVASTTSASSLSSGNSTLYVKSSVTPVTTKVDTTRVSTIYNIPQYNISMPATSPLPATAAYNNDPVTYPTTLRAGATSIGATGTTTVCAIRSTAGNPGLYLYNSSDILNIYGDVILDVTGTNSSNGTLYTLYGKIIINTGASLTVKFNGQLYIGGYSPYSGGIQNLTKDPKSCLLIGTTSTTSYYWASTSNMEFYGTIYMPNAPVYIWQNVTYYGAITARNVYFNYAAAYHYDTSLRTAAYGTVTQGYYATTWRELTSPTERITLP